MLPLDKELLSFAEQLADRARGITRQYFRQALSIIDKNDASPVTVADQETEAALRALINQHYPGHGIIGEEYGAQTSASPYRWIIDPIDGTRSFISGFPIYCTLIALLYHDKPVLSIIDMPMLDERFLAAGEGSRLNGQTIRVSQCREISQALAYSTDPGMFDVRQYERHQQVARQVRQQRYTGDGYAYAMLAAGWIDLVVEAGMKIHDFLPLIPIIEEAGGIISDWQGQPLTTRSNGEILAAATPELHRQAMALLN